MIYSVKQNSKFQFNFLIVLERALRALASSSGGAACPGGNRGQPRGSTQGVRGWFPGDLSKKKILWRTHVRTWIYADGWIWGIPQIVVCMYSTAKISLFRNSPFCRIFKLFPSFHNTSPDCWFLHCKYSSDCRFQEQKNPTKWGTQLGRFHISITKPGTFFRLSEKFPTL